MRPTRVVVVDLPFVPVMATTRRAASGRRSPDHGTPARARGSPPPGQRHARAQHDQVRAGERVGLVPSSGSRPQRPASRPADGRSPSVSVTAAPRRTSSSAAVVSAALTTSTLAAVKSWASSQARQTEEGEEIARIRNRVMTFGSSQPMSSK
jgi:hypothetical protein